MSDCSDKPSAVATPSALDLLSNNGKSSSSITSCPSSSHPNRLMEFEDKDITMRFVMQHTIESNIRTNSLQFDPREFYRRPDACTMKLLTPQILNEVEKELVKGLSEGLYRMVINNGASSSFNAAQFKNSNMKQSELSPATIEAALTHIVEHLDQHTNLITALGEGKIGYHDKGAMLNDMGVRMFVIKGQEKANNAK
ncbi:unnamed protein product [Rotaria sp. Silwood2]|nr:unnamed protein product [Rotaria sp. Silwood2]